MFERETLQRNRLQTIADIAKGKHFNYKVPEFNYQSLVKIFETQPFEMHYDFSHRTAIHDCLDFKSLEIT